MRDKTKNKLVINALQLKVWLGDATEGEKLTLQLLTAASRKGDKQCLHTTK